MATTGERELWEEYVRTRDEEVRNRLVLQYAPLVKFVVGRLQARLPESVDRADLVSDGILGLIDAIDRFDPARGLTFQTFAVPRIRGAIIDAMRSLDWVPRSVRERIRALEQAHVDLQVAHGRPAEDEQVAEHLGISLAQLRDLYARSAATSFASAEDVEIADELDVAASDAVEEADTRAVLLDVVETLPERDRILVALYYFERLTFAEIGQVLGVSESRVSQLHSRATMVLRARLVERDVH